MFLPLDRMLDRLKHAREDSDSEFLLTLLYTGEMLLKTVASGLIASVLDDKERHRYRLCHDLVRANGLGDWRAAIDAVLVGPASHHLDPAARQERDELTSYSRKGSWQYDAASLVLESLVAVGTGRDAIGSKVQGRAWFEIFVDLRNATRGHGAIASKVYRKVCEPLEKSIRLIIDGFSLFKRPWAFLHRNLSGKYKILAYTHDAKPFEHLKSTKSENYLDGVYLSLSALHRVELVYSDADASDFLLPNGNWSANASRFETISYITGNRPHRDGTPYTTPGGTLPSSETAGVGELDQQGQCWANLPPAPKGYISRPMLENELLETLCNDRHPIVTLWGRGGIGKTWLALTALHRLSNQHDRFYGIVWLSSRDIDLMPTGPKTVQPQVLTKDDMARELVSLLEPSERSEKGFSARAYMESALQKSPLGRPMLIVLDNFETVRDPLDFYRWLDAHVRLPNKILITSRFHQFKADYPVEVPGMSEPECRDLIRDTASHLGIIQLLTDQYCEELFREADGHPYVTKILLGDVATVGQLVRIERIVAAKDDILDALFERTFNAITPETRRVFLTLCGWRSVIPALALQAVLLRAENERMDIGEALSELRRFSLVEMSISEKDGTEFVSVPLAAQVYGRKKLAVSAMRTAVDADIEILRYFGAAQRGDIRHGVERHIRRFAVRLSESPDVFQKHLPFLECIARQYLPAWLLLAQLYEERNDWEKAKASLRQYLASVDEPSNRQRAWERLAAICRKSDDSSGEVHALVEMCESPKTNWSAVSDTANRINSLFRLGALRLDSDEKALLVRRLIQIAEHRKGEADATDCSRIGWLCSHAKDEHSAFKWGEVGLSRDPDNEHCKNLVIRFAPHAGR